MRQLGELERVFTPTHETYGEHLRVMIVTLDMLRDGIKTFCIEAWGSYPDNWESWRNTGTPDQSDYDGKGD